MHSGNLLEPESDCVYFDNVQATLTETDPPCITECDGFDLISSKLQGAVCISTLIENSKECAPDAEVSEAFENFEDICIDSTLFTFNNVTGEWEELGDNDICLEQIAEQEAADAATSALETPEEAFAFFEFMFSPLFIFFIMSMIISGILAGGLSKASNGGHVFEVFGVSMLIFILIGSLPGIGGVPGVGIIPIWISVAIVAVIALLIANKLKSLSVVGGGGG